MSKSKFDYMIFTGGYDGDEFVVHAVKYTKRQAMDLFVTECNQTMPKYEDVQTRWVKYFINAPEYVGSGEFEGAVYTFCDEGVKGCFPVWVIPCSGGKDN